MSPAPPIILDLHSSSSANGAYSLPASIGSSLQLGDAVTPDVLEGEERVSYRRSIPTEVLYSAKGLEIYDQITKLKGTLPAGLVRWSWARSRCGRAVWARGRVGNASAIASRDRSR